MSNSQTTEGLTETVYFTREAALEAQVARTKATREAAYAARVEATEAFEAAAAKATELQYKAAEVFSEWYLAVEAEKEAIALLQAAR